MSLSQAASVLDARVQGADVVFEAVSKDSRTVKPGDLYVALRGERFDGHAFIAEAAERGAVAAMVSAPQALDLPQLCVDDSHAALGRLAAWWAAQWRARHGRCLLGVTGSNGKTTVKEMCRAIFAAHAGDEAVHATPGNYNNDIGLPLTLLQLRAPHRYAVIEMGASGEGEIAALAAMTKPDVALVNNVAPAHLEGFGSLDAVAAAKAEIYRALASEGVAVINADDAYAPLFDRLAGRARQIRFSLRDPGADVHLLESATAREVQTPAGRFALQLAAPGEHNLRNALAATALALAAGVAVETIARGLAAFRPVRGRLAVVEPGGGLRLIDDSYNANPASMRAAIDVLAAMEGEKILVMGDMAELGREAAGLHAQAGRYAREQGIDRLFACGALSRHAAEAFGEGAVQAGTQAEIIAALRQLPAAPARVILVKGSRSAAMDAVVAALASAEGEGA